MEEAPGSTVTVYEPGQTSRRSQLPGLAKVEGISSFFREWVSKRAGRQGLEGLMEDDAARRIGVSPMRISYFLKETRPVAPSRAALKPGEGAAACPRGRDASTGGVFRVERESGDWGTERRNGKNSNDPSAPGDRYAFRADRLPRAFLHSLMLAANKSGSMMTKTTTIAILSALTCMMISFQFG